VVELRSDNPTPYVSLAWVLLRLKRPKEAAARARRATELAPSLPAAYRYLGTALDDLGDRLGAIASYRRAVELAPTDHNTHSGLIVAMLTEPSCDSKAIFGEARAWAKRHAEPLGVHWRPHTNAKEPERRLRVGYVSPDLRAHPIQQFLVPLLKQHDQSVVELFLYSSVDQPDAETEWYRTFAGSHFREIQRTDDLQVAELVRRDGVDILVDLALHSSSPRLRLFACKPAPVQFTWLGYPGTTGLDSIDYRITDHFCDPPGTDLSVYSEESIFVPGSFWCYESLHADLAVGALPALANGAITFGCQNNPRKLHPWLLALWARVLGEVPESRLFLYLEDYAQEGVLQTLADHGVQPERVEFGGRVSRREYLERYQRIDIALDTFPYAGATTSFDAIWMGVPFITLRGGPTVQRAGVAIAMNLGLPELIADSEDEYVAKAVALAHDLERLARLRTELRSRLEASPVGDTPSFARNLEAAYRTAWRRYCSQG
jgi:protein O-GlcNAc transferase